MTASAEPTRDAIDWEPLHPQHGSNFRTHNLVSPRPDRLEFQLTPFNKFFLWLVPGVGVLALLVAIPTWFAIGWYALIAVAAGLFFLGVGLSIFKKSWVPICFDKTAAQFAIGNEPTPLDSVHALQLLAHFMQDTGPDRNEFWSFELNLVLHDGSRTHVVGHGDGETLREDAHRIGEFLGRPVWDGTEK